MAESKPDDYQNLLIRCDCKAHEFIEFSEFHDDPRVIYITHSTWPDSFWERLRDIWRVIRGKKWSIGAEIILSDEDKERLIDFLQKS